MHSTTARDHQLEPDKSGDPPQLNLPGLMAVVGWKKPPPERALWRELVNLAIGTAATLTHAGRSVAASAVHHVALALYMRANSAGVIDGLNVPALATDCRRDERTVKAALGVLRNVRVLRMDRPGGRRAPARWRMNLGGLTWATARRQVRVPTRSVRKYTARAQLKPSGAPEPASGRGETGCCGRPARFCQEQTHVLAEQFGSTEHDGFRVPYLSGNTPKPHSIDRPADRAAGTCAAATLISERTANPPCPWAVESPGHGGSTLDSRSTPAVRATRSPLAGAWAGPGAVRRRARRPAPPAPLAVYFCTNLVGTLSCTVLTRWAT